MMTAMGTPRNNPSMTTQAFPINAITWSGPPGTEAWRLSSSAESQDTLQW